MAVKVFHKFKIAVPEDSVAGTNPNYAGPNEWNDTHALYWDTNNQNVATYTVDKVADMGTLILLGTTVTTVTLPAPVSGSHPVSGDTIDCYEGWWCALKNIGTTSIPTIGAAAGNIDGVASIPLAPGNEIICITDGTNFWTVGFLDGGTF